VVSSARSGEILDLARRSGTLEAADLRRRGIDPRFLWRLARSGALVRVRRGVYALPDPCDDPKRGAQLIARHLDAAVSHGSAAALYGFGPGTAPPLHLTSRRQLEAPAGLVVHVTRHLGTEDVRTMDGCPVTSPARTLVDVSAAGSGLTDDQLVDFVDLLIARRWVTVASLERYLATAPRRPGTRRLRRLLAATAGQRVESAAERRLLRLLEEAGLPAPVNQFRLCDAAGHLVARIDHAWPAHRLALEVDGYRYHSGTRAFRYDRERATLIQAEGWTVFRTSPAEIAEGAATLVAALRVRLEPDVSPVAPPSGHLLPPSRARRKRTQARPEPSGRQERPEPSALQEPPALQAPWRAHRR